MENRTNQIITLSSGREYYVNRQILYKGKTYYVATLVAEERDENGNEKPADEIVFFEQFMEGEKEMVIPVSDPEVIKLIAENL